MYYSLSRALRKLVCGAHAPFLRLSWAAVRPDAPFLSPYVYYEVDDDEVPTVLPLEAYGIDEECGWWLLEETGANG